MYSYIVLSKCHSNAGKQPCPPTLLKSNRHVVVEHLLPSLLHTKYPETTTTMITTSAAGWCMVQFIDLVGVYLEMFCLVSL